MDRPTGLQGGWSDRSNQQRTALRRVDYSGAGRTKTRAGAPVQCAGPGPSTQPMKLKTLKAPLSWPMTTMVASSAPIAATVITDSMIK